MPADAKNPPADSQHAACFSTPDARSTPGKPLILWFAEIINMTGKDFKAALYLR
jgi:hypothetical protein